jgi:hypothetical protein
MLNELINKNKEQILKSWRDRIFGGYPAEASKMLASNKDRFANPVGYSIKNGTKIIIEQLTGNMERSEIRKALDDIVRIRSVQDFTPYQATEFIFQLKRCVWNMINDSQTDDISLREISQLDSKIDDIALMTFEIYSECREKLFEVKANNIKMRSNRLFERTGVADSIPESKGEENDGSIP